MWDCMIPDIIIIILQQGSPGLAVQLNCGQRRKTKVFIFHCVIKLFSDLEKIAISNGGSYRNQHFAL